MKCPGKTPTGKDCGRKVVPGASMCEHHYKENRKEQARAKAEHEWAVHCETKCNHASRTCKRPRHGDNELCKQCLNAQARRNAAEAAALEKQQKMAEEDKEFDMTIRNAPWWPGFERWLRSTIEEIAQAKVDECDCSYRSSYGW